MKNIILRVKLFLILFMAFANQVNSQQNCYGEVLLDSLDNLEKYPGDEVMLKLIQNAIPRILEEDDLPSYYTCVLNLCNLYYNLNQHNMYGKYITLAAKLAEDTINFPQEYMGSILNNLAVHQSTTGNYKLAVNTYLRSIEEEKKTNNDPYEIPIIYDNINNVYSTLGDYKKAIEYSRRSYEMKKESDSKYYKSNPNYRHYQMAISLYNIGNAQQKMKDYDKAIHHLEQSLTELYAYKPKKTSSKNKKLIKTYHKLAFIYYQKQNAPLMLKHLKKASALQKVTDYKKYKNLELYGNYNLLLKKYSEAERYLQEALDISKKEFEKNKEDPIPAVTLNHLGDLKVKMNEKNKAIAYYHQGLQFIDARLVDDQLNNPIISDVQASSQGLQLLQKKSKTAYALYLEDKIKNAHYLEVSFNAYLATARLLDNMRADFLSENSKFYVVETASPIFQEGIEVLFEYFNTTRSDIVINNILEYIEFSKSSILFESIQNKLKLATSNIPQAILNEESELATSLSYYEKILSKERLKKGKGSNKTIASIEETLFELNENFALLNQKIKSNYPKYYNLKTERINKNKLSALQANLEDDQLLLEYFVTKNEIYFIAISDNKATFHKSNKEGIKEIINSFYDEISKKPRIERQHNDYKTKGYTLYQELIKMAIHIHGQKQNLIVIPDNILNKISFDCLYNKNSEGIYYPIIKDFNTSYLFSIDQLGKSKTTIENQKVLCLAPTFENNSQFENIDRDCQNARLFNLPYAQEELDYLSNNFNGKFLSGEDAKAYDFLENLKDHNIIHLATHGCLNESNPMLSEIYFHDQSLTNYELENLNVQPELVVLSACNTANGEIKKGEGVISLSRGFFEAGVKSLQSSLWSIDDFTSSEIMKSMYKHLKIGQSKSEALRLAKLQHLDSSDKLRSHPYFWAAMIHIGNQDPIFQPSKRKWLIISIGVILCVILTGYLIKHKKLIRSYT